jgi:addiction module HigA family antidote
MKNPPHPGQSVRADCLEALGLTVTEAAKALGVSRQALNNIIHSQAAISPEMAIRLERRSAAALIHSFGCRRPTIWHRRKKMPTKLRYGGWRVDVNCSSLTPASRLKPHA